MSSPFLRALLYILLVLGSLLINAVSLASTSAQSHIDVEFENEGRNIEKLSLRPAGCYYASSFAKGFRDTREPGTYLPRPARPVGIRQGVRQGLAESAGDRIHFHRRVSAKRAGSKVPRTRRLPRLRT